METPVTLERYVKVILLCSITIIGGFVLYQVLTNRPPPSINFAILNENQQLGNYPNNVSVNEKIYLRYYIRNNHPSISKFSVRTYLANTYSTVSFTRGVDNATQLEFYNNTINFNENFTSNPIPFTIDKEGISYRICFELWVLNETRWNYLEYSVQYLWINCTL